MVSVERVPLGQADAHVTVSGRDKAAAHGYRRTNPPFPLPWVELVFALPVLLVAAGALSFWARKDVNGSLAALCLRRWFQEGLTLLSTSYQSR